MSTSTAFTWYNLPNGRKMAKFDVSSGLTYVVNFVEYEKGTYDCFMYPSISSQNNYAQMASIFKMDQRVLQEKVYITLKKVLEEFATKYQPHSITFLTQFQNQLGKLSSSTIPGFHSEFSSGGQVRLVKGK